jgi:NADPH:quinone reductase-like Zn-dependent oxidoreductase
VIIGQQGGSRAELDLGVLQGKRASIHATTLRARPLAEKAAIVSAVRENVWPLVSAGKLVPIIDRTLPMPSAAESHRVLEAGSHVGKVLLVR